MAMRARFWVGIAAAALMLAACDKDKGEKPDEDDAEASDDDDSGDDEDEDDGKKKKKKSKSKKKKKKKKKKNKKSDDDDDSDDDGADEGEAAAECGPPSVVPEIPASRSNPPTLAEWGSACTVNTQGAGSQAADCTTKIKREWLQITCRGNITGYEHFDGFGNEGQDYFKQITRGELASFVVRLRKGRNQKVRICRGKERASLFVSWPPSAPRPLHVALATGPKCDGSGWGAK
jgi:hypothetical protein